MLVKYIESFFRVLSNTAPFAATGVPQVPPTILVEIRVSVSNR